MSTADPNGLSREHWIRQVADRLSPELRAEYYRILRHCRSLPENDELLIVLNAIQVFVSLAIDVPHFMAVEREQMAQLIQPAVKAQEDTVHSFHQLHAQLDERLAGLPDEIARLIQPEAIAAKINESLRQQFEQTTIPETANILRTGLDEINTLAVDLRGGARTIGRTLNEATLEANGFLTRVQAACLDGTEKVARAAERIATILKTSIGTLLLLACGVGFALGLMVGVFLHEWWDVPLHPMQAAVVQPQTPPVEQPAEARPKAQMHRK